MKLNLSLRKGSTNIIFTSPIKLNNHIKLNKAEIIWTVYNVGNDEKILIDTTEHDILQGYYTFENLKDFLVDLNCNVILEKNGKCSVTPPSSKSLNLKNIGRLLGFEKNKTLTKKETSPYIVDIHGGLREISIFCNRVDTLRNYDMGKRSEKICDILIPSGNLFGHTSSHLLETSTPVEISEISFIEFTVKDNSFLTDKDSYLILLDCSLV